MTRSTGRTGMRRRARCAGGRGQCRSSAGAACTGASPAAACPCGGTVLGGQGRPSIPPPGDGRASPRLAGGRTVSSQRCPPPHSSGAVANSRPVEQRFPSRSRAPGWDKSRGNLLRSQAAPETLSYGPKVVVFPNLFFPLILLKNVVCIMLQIVGCVLFFFFLN